MNIPGFTAELALAKSRLEVNWASPEETRLAGMSISGRIDVSRSITPAAMDPKQQAYKECLAECRFEGGALQDCKNQCKAEVFPPVGHGTAPGTSGIVIYGNYCGPGHGDPTGLTPPVDAVDAACRAHDMCYDATNYFNCGCDRALLGALPMAIAATPTSAGKAAGMLITAHFMGEPCACISPVCVFVPHLCTGVGGNGAIC
jgi:hypothetical protein